MNFFSQYKKILLSILFLIIVFLIGFLLYNTFFKPTFKTPEEQAPDTTSTSSSGKLTGADLEPGGTIVDEERGFITETKDADKNKSITVDAKAKGGVTKTSTLNNNRSLNPSLSSDGSDVRYYNQDDGKFYRIDSSGRLTKLSDQIFYNVDNITWSGATDKAIIEYPDGANIIYDFNTNKQVTLPKHWQDFQFSSNGKQIIMESIGIDPDNKWLAISNDDGSGGKILESIGENSDDVYPLWSPTSQTVALNTRGVGLNRQEVIFIGQNNENFKSTIIEGRGFQPKWSADGNKLLYSVYSTDNDLKPRLWIVDAYGDSIGNNRKNLGLETWAEKCTFENNNIIYCAVPTFLENGSGAFPELANNTNDQIYRIDTKTGLKRIVAIPDASYSVKDLIVSDDGKNLFFTDSKLGNIHKIELK